MLKPKSMSIVCFPQTLQRKAPASSYEPYYIKCNSAHSNNIGISVSTWKCQYCQAVWLMKTSLGSELAPCITTWFWGETHFCDTSVIHYAKCQRQEQKNNHWNRKMYMRATLAKSTMHCECVRILFTLLLSTWYRKFTCNLLLTIHTPTGEEIQRIKHTQGSEM